MARRRAFGREILKIQKKRVAVLTATLFFIIPDLVRRSY